MRSQPPKITVAIIFYNSMPHLPQAVASVLNQDYSDFELLLVDDGSTDGSLEFAKSVRDPRVRAISDGQNKKLNYRLNQSIALSKGIYYARMDADDVMFFNRLGVQAKYLDENPEIQVVGSAAITIDDQGNLLSKRAERLRPVGVYQAKNRFIHPSIVGRKTWFQEHPYNENFLYHRSQDAELWVRTANEDVFACLESPLLFYREPLSLKVSNYLGTQMGLLAIPHNSKTIVGFNRYVWTLYECLKLILVLFMCLAGKDKWLIRRRGADLNQKEIENYGRIFLKSIGNSTLPKVEY